ncbi:tripartite tricarboxylate transporter TctB family protein [Sphaerochaeta sp.]|jgi:drug/metabolite transporter (DMT)-like permease|uniref:tripartite tricarboxylate transporter TctB family protein n=1 Tax=Sphaerochaeta sp. TaxID=1972642 RepID=UPI002FC9537E
MTKRNADITAGIAFFAFAGLLFIGSGFMPTRNGGIPALNTGFYPRILAVLLAILSVLMVVEAIRKQKTEEQVETWWNTKSAFFMFFITLLLLVAYPPIMKTFGFATASFLFITILTWLLSEKGNRKPVWIIGISLGITAIVYVIFKMILAIPFPQGMLL